MFLVRITLKTLSQPVDMRCDCVGFSEGSLILIRKKGLPVIYPVGIIETFTVVKDV